jgi:hypothetical protein
VRVSKWLVYVAGAAVSVAYVLNPTLGLFELLPDNLPWVGNLDEAAFTGLLIFCLRGMRRLAKREEAPSSPGAGPRGE